MKNRLEQLIREKTNIKLDMNKRDVYTIVFIGQNTYMNYIRSFLRDHLNVDSLTICEPRAVRMYDTMQDKYVDIEDVPLHTEDVVVADKYNIKYEPCTNHLVSYELDGNEWKIRYVDGSDGGQEKVVYCLKILLCSSESLVHGDTVMVDNKERYRVVGDKIQVIDDSYKYPVYYLKETRPYKHPSLSLYRIHPFYIKYDHTKDMLNQLILASLVAYVAPP